MTYAHTERAPRRNAAGVRPHGMPCELEELSADYGAHPGEGIQPEHGGTGAPVNGQIPRGVFDVDVDRALEALRLTWGDAYDIGCEQGQWTAASRSNSARIFTGDTPDALNLAIRADWASEGTL